MGAVWMRARAELRARWRSWMAMGVLVGLAGGAAIAAVAGARRTESAYPRFLRAQRAMDILADVRGPDGIPAPLERVRAIPQVQDASTALALFASTILTAEGHRLVFPDVFTIVSRDGRFTTELNRSKILEGRHPDPTRDDEALVGFTVAERFGIAVGDSLQLDLGGVDPERQAPTGEVVLRHTLRVTGIGAMPGEFQALAGASLPSVQLTPAFLRRFERHTTPDEAFAIRLRGGIRDLPAFEREATARGYHPRAFFQQVTQTASVRRSTRFQAVALWLLGGLIALAGVAVLGQALARQASLEADEFPALRALGMGRPQLVAVGLVRSTVIAVVAATLAGVGAVASSPLTPVGLARVAEPDPGIAIDLFAVGIGAAAILAVVGLVSALAHWRAARGAVLASTFRAQPERPSRVAEALARAGAPASAVTGTRLALERGRGRTAVPVRSTVIGVALGVLAVTSALTFGESMDHLIETPGLTGWTFDLIAGGTPEELDGFERALRARGMVTARADGFVPTLVVEGAETLDSGLVLPPGPIEPAIAEGRAPAAPDEAALGRDTMRRFGLRIGDPVEIAAVFEGEGGEPQRTRPVSFRVVGRLIQPAIGFNLGSAGQGAAITPEGFHRLGKPESPANRGLFFRLRSEADVRDAVERVAPRFPTVFVSGRRESSVAADMSRLSGIPLLLAGILGAMAVATMVHTLLTSIRRRARDLAILRTIGFVGSQVRAAVGWQATTLVVAAVAIGMPAGIALGRWGWLAFADSLGVVPIATAPAVALTLVVPAVLVLANLVGVVPARAAARTQPAVVLRTE